MRKVAVRQALSRGQAGWLFPALLLLALSRPASGAANQGIALEAFVGKVRIIESKMEAAAFLPA